MDKQIKQLYEPLFLYVKKRVNNPEDAKDLTQEVFYKLSKSSCDSIDNVKSWMYTIAKNTITDFYRKKKIYTEEVSVNSVCFEIEAENTSLELSECVSLFVEELPEEYRFIMTLSELKEIPQKEIAKQLNMNYATVRSKVQRGRKKLKELFSEYCIVTQGGRGSILECMPKTEFNSSISCTC